MIAASTESFDKTKQDVCVQRERECQEIVCNCISKHVHLCENIEDNLYFYNVFMPMEPVKHLPV